MAPWRFWLNPAGHIRLETSRIFCRARFEPRRARLRKPVAKERHPGLQRPIADYTQQADPRRLIAIGASTGGTEALREVLTELPGNCPPIVIVQHIPALFSKAFAERLDSLCRIQVREAADGDEIRPGMAFIAPGDLHLSVRRTANGYCTVVQTGTRICYQRPSVDVLFDSMAREAGADGVGIILTGMGTDGARGMLKMKRAGAWTIAQDEESFVVFGMPKEAIRSGAVDRVLPIGEIARELLAGVQT